MTAERPQRLGGGLLFGWLRNRAGVAGLVCGLAVWVFSVGALGLAMRANMAASVQERTHDFIGAQLMVRHLHIRAVAWSLGFTASQLTSFLVFVLVLRACYHLRMAICFSIGAGFVMLGDVLGLFILLLWLWVTQGVG